MGWWNKQREEEYKEYLEEEDEYLDDDDDEYEEEEDEYEEEGDQILLKENKALKSKVTSLEGVVEKRNAEKIDLENRVGILQANYSKVTDHLNQVKKSYSVLEKEYRALKELERTESESKVHSEDWKQTSHKLENEKIELVNQLNYTKTELADVILDAKKIANKVIEDAKQEAQDYQKSMEVSRELAKSDLNDVFFGLQRCKEKINKTIEEVEKERMNY